MENSNQQLPPTPGSEPSSLIERVSSSIVLKLVIMLVLVLFLLIPLSWVQEIIGERSARGMEVDNEIASKWGGPQVISGPVIGIPYRYPQQLKTINEKGVAQIENYMETEYAFIVADQSTVKAEVDPELRKRGIYQSVVYNALVTVNGSFGDINFDKLGIKPDDIQWQDAKMFIGLSDVKGLKAAPKISWQGKDSVFQMTNGEVALFEQNMFVPIDLKGTSTKGQFTIRLDMRGSKALTVFPTADETAIAAKGAWPDPSFDGGFLPEQREVDQQAFSASWHLPSFGRKFPKQWVGAKKALYNPLSLHREFPEPTVNHVSEASSDTPQLSNLQDMVQINFLESVNNYQKTSRVAKYAVLVILLTFTSLFFSEIIKKQRVHLIQYVLIGCAMVLFYSLLLAISEHIGFDWGYLLAAVATIGLISSFIFGITRDRTLSLYFSGILFICYSFIYFLLQLQDYALIVGTIGVFVILALLMRFSLKVNWYQFEQRSL